MIFGFWILVYLVNVSDYVNDSLLVNLVFLVLYQILLLSKHLPLLIQFLLFKHFYKLRNLQNPDYHSAFKYESLTEEITARNEEYEEAMLEYDSGLSMFQGVMFKKWWFWKGIIEQLILFILVINSL